MSDYKMVKNELFNPTIMAKILRHEGISDEVKKRLKKYNLSRTNGNTVAVIYEYGKKFQEKEFGRLFAKQSLGLQGFEKDVRNALAQGLYFDVDMKNAHPTILTHVCKEREWNCDAMKYYVDHRDDLLNEVMEHCTVSRALAKQLFLQLMFGGTFDSWQTQHIPGSQVSAPTFIDKFTIELKAISKNIWDAQPDIAKYVTKQKNGNKYGSCLSLFCQNEESLIIRCLNDALHANNRSLDVLIHDGGLVRRLKGEEEFPQEILRNCETYIKEKLGYEILLDLKEIKSTLSFTEKPSNVIEGDIIIDDVFAAKRFVHLMDGYIKYSNGEVLIFDENTGLWTTNPIAVRYNIHKFDKELKFEQVIQDGKVKTYNYSGNESNITKLLKSVPVFCSDDDFINKNIDTSRGKLLWSDGIYDFDTDTFAEEFDPSIVFVDRIDRPFPKDRDDSLVEEVNKILFKDPFIAVDMDASDYLKQVYAQGIYGDYRIKKFIFNVGAANAAKGVHVDAIKGAFGGYIGMFNGSALIFNKNSGADSAKQLSWMVPIKNKRLCFSNELEMEKPVSGTLIAKAASGGDINQARQNGKDEAETKMRALLVCNCNDIPKINPYNDAQEERVRCVTFKCKFVREVIDPEYERLADKGIKDKFLNDDNYKNCVFFIIRDAYQVLLNNGEFEAESVKQATKEWTGAESSMLSIIEKGYEITKNVDDFAISSRLKTFINKSTHASAKRISIELHKQGCRSGEPRRFNGKVEQIWLGIKELRCFEDIQEVADEM